MKRLIRFEDKYGVFDIFSRQNKNSQAIECRQIIECYTDVYITRGCSSPQIFTMDIFEVESAAQLGITEILLVFDLDNFESNNKLLGKKQFTNKVGSLVGLLNKYNIVLRFVPVCYTAEHIALVNYSKDIKSLKIEEYVHYENYKSFVVHLIGCLEILSIRDVKKFNLYLDMQKVINNLNQLSGVNYNHDMINVLNFNYTSLSYEEVIEYLYKVNCVFADAVKKSKGIIMQIGNKTISLSESIDNINQFLIANAGRGSISFSN